MLKRIITLILIHGLLQGSHTTDTVDYGIILVHIGASLPTYITTALRQARLFNPTTPIYLIAQEQALKDYTRQSEIEILPISCESLQPCAEHILFRNHSKLDHRFRNGFWNHATERFFYLYECMQQHNLSNIVHIENDVMLYVDIATLLPTFQRLCPALGAIFDNEVRCIPSLMYISTSSALKPLIDHISALSKSKKTYTDMESIAHYRAAYGADAVTALPIIMPEYLEHNSLASSTGHRSSRPQMFCEHAVAFNSIFDGAALGQYLGGIDPRNGISTPGFINESCLFNPALITLTWQQDEQKRYIPYACYGNTTLWRINNLHIHSKHLELFTSYTQGAP